MSATLYGPALSWGMTLGLIVGISWVFALFNGQGPDGDA